MAQGRNGEAGRRNYTPRPRQYTKQAAMDRMVELLQNGVTIEAACEKVGRSRKSYEAWRKNDPEFKARCDQARALRKKVETQPGERLPFEEWRRRFLGRETYWHQLQWIDLLEGREPRDMHDAQKYHKGRRNRVIVNTPPAHAKSTTVTEDYVVYRICMDPSVMIKVISQTERMAKEFLYGIKRRLTHPDNLELQKAYAPDGGWEATADAWTRTEIYVGGADRNASEKDPTVQALGLGGQIYGARTDLIIMDDCVTGKNAHMYEQQISWLQREVENRPGPNGKILVIGTRLAPVDLYSELLNPDNYLSGKVPWTYLSQPAILEDSNDLEQVKSVWPYSHEGGWGEECECGSRKCVDGFELDGRQVWPRWDGPHLNMLRENATAANFALVYLQTAASDDATFPQHAVTGSTSHFRVPGLLRSETKGYPHQGMHGMYVIAGCDPAVKGHAGLTVAAIDRETEKRYLLNAVNLKAPTPSKLKESMQEMTLHYGVNEWRVERTGLLQLFTQDEPLRQFMQTRGVKFHEHYTGGNKWDPAFGVASLSPLFGQWTRATGPHGEYTTEWEPIVEPLIELPKVMTEGMRALVHQLITWTPDIDPARTPCDLVMSLWFLEIGAREYLNRGRKRGTVTALRRSNPFVSPRSPRLARNN